MKNKSKVNYKYIYGSRHKNTIKYFTVLGMVLRQENGHFKFRVSY